MERRLAAILAADVVGYSRLVRADEEATIAALQALRVDLIDPKLRDHNGRIVKLMGDGMLAEFASVVDAVRAAVEIQQALAEHNSNLPEDSKIEFRVGINLGDVVIDGDDIQGDGVNVAARLEGIAEPGGICVSGMVYEGVRDRVDFPFDDLGEREVKNISRPVRVWQWTPTASVVTATTATDAPLPLPDKPSVAVLAFNSMSDDPQHEYLAEGLSEDITTLLARIPGFFVIARNSSFSYKGTAPDIREVGRELGVRYVIEGSLRPVGKQLRVTVQLIDAASGQHIWAQRFDQPVDTIYEVQDDITGAILSHLQPELTRAEFELVQRRSPADFDAWSYYQQAGGLLAIKGWHEDTFTEAADLYRRAIAIDADFAPAHAGLSLILALGHMVGFISEPDEALAASERALALDSDHSEVLGNTGCALCDLGYPDRGIEILERALEKDPSNAQALVALGTAFLITGKFDEAVEKLGHGLRISPQDQRLGFWGGIYALALGRVGRMEEAIEQARIACRRDGKVSNSRVIMAVLLLHDDRQKEAASALAEARRIHPDLSHREIEGLVGPKSAAALKAIWA